METYTSLLAPNASLLTGPGTNTLILGQDDQEGALVIDPADNHETHLQAIIQEGRRRGGIRKILITHGHPDHLGGAAELRKQLGVPVYAYSREGVPLLDNELCDGATIPVGSDTLHVLHTPGHRFDHLAFWLERARILFAGDLISGITTNVIIPPEGDMLDYLNSLHRLQTLPITTIVPAHGPEIADPASKIAEYILHRQAREQQILQTLAVSGSATTIPLLVASIYKDVDPALHPIAAYTVEAHLLKLLREKKVQVQADSWKLVEKMTG